MDRKGFIKSCGYACLGGAGVTALLQGCTSARVMSGKIAGDDLIVPLSDFITKAGNEIHYKKYLVLHNEILQYPVCVYRISDTEYTALWMQCTHQGAELQVFGDKLQCPAHGSEFSRYGAVQGGPAEAKLRTFPVTQEAGQLKISLKAI